MKRQRGIASLLCINTAVVERCSCAQLPTYSTTHLVGAWETNERTNERANERRAREKERTIESSVENVESKDEFKYSNIRIIRAFLSSVQLLF